AEALTQFQNAPAGSIRARLGRSLVAVRQGRFEDAARERTGGNDAPLIVERALADLLTGDPAAARAALEALPPGAEMFAQAQALLSNVYLVQNRKADARAAAERAIAAAPDSPSAHLAL